MTFLTVNQSYKLFKMAAKVGAFTNGPLAGNKANNADTVYSMPDFFMVKCVTYNLANISFPGLNIRDIVC